ncbi:MAG: hypothetical protein R6V40_04490, partial [Candidatus Moraniibacteriota bacterium]
ETEKEEIEDPLDYVKVLRKKFLSREEDINQDLNRFIEKTESSLEKFKTLPDQEKESIKEEINWRPGWDEPGDWSERIATELRTKVKSAGEEQFEEDKNPILCALLELHKRMG